MGMIVGRQHPGDPECGKACQDAGKSRRKNPAYVVQLPTEAAQRQPDADKCGRRRQNMEAMLREEWSRLRQRLVVDPEIRFGKPCVRGTRISVGDVLGFLASGMTAEEVVEEYPSLTLDDVLACLAYAADRESRTDTLPAA